MRTILFICSGNTCRSPLAEAIAREAIDRGALGASPEVFVASAGVSATEGMDVTPETLNALHQRDISHTGASKRLTAEMIRNADIVFAMTEAHVQAARDLVGNEPKPAEKIVLLDPKGDVVDPIGQGQVAYDILAEKMAGLIPRRLQEMLGT